MDRMILIFFLLVCSITIRAQHTEVEVQAGKYDRVQTPVKFRVDKPFDKSVAYELVNRKTGISLPVQLLDSLTFVFIPEKKLEAGSTTIYTLRKSRSVKSRIPVIIKKNSQGISATVNGKPLFFYHSLPALPPADSPAYYQRSGFIHPLFSPSGNILTDDFPAGHAHQHGIFMAWVHTRFKDSLVDFWNPAERLGKVEHFALRKLREGPVMSEIQLELQHRSFLFGQILREIWTISIYPFSNYFLFDIASEQINITSDTLFLEAYRYGGMAFRGSREWNTSDSLHFTNNWQILTSEGLDRMNANHTHARWVDASGKIRGNMSGLTVFDHPDNFRYPQTMRVHPDMCYWVYAPEVDGPFSMVPGLPYRSRYRYLVHEGGPDKNLISSTEKDWVEPPVVRVMNK